MEEVPTVYEPVLKDSRTRPSFIGILFGDPVWRTTELFAALCYGVASGSVLTPFLVEQWRSNVLDNDPH